MSTQTSSLDNASRIRSLRDELAELRDPGPQDAIGHRLYLDLKGSLEADLADLGAPVQVPVLARQPLHPAIRLSSPKAPKPAEAVTVPTPADAEVIHPAHLKPGPHQLPPADRLADLLAKHATLDAAGRQTAAGQVRLRIRKLCATHGLALPDVAAKRPQTTPYKNRKPPTGPRKPRAKRVVREVTADGAVTFNGLPLPSAEAMARPYQHLLDHIDTPTPAARIRALRSQALEILPDLEDLSAEQAAQVRLELALLSETLVLGSHLSERAS